jgi:hypothetical protein
VLVVYPKDLEVLYAYVITIDDNPEVDHKAYLVSSGVLLLNS